MDFYYHPEKYGMTSIGFVDWGYGGYDFDLLQVWQKEDGTFVFGEDSGCSCPTPFQDQDVEDLTRINSLSIFKDYLSAHASKNDNSAMEIANLLAKLHELGVR